MNETVENETADLLDVEKWRCGIASYAAHASYWRKHWHPYPFLCHIAEALEDASRIPNSRVLITAPPRHGKSELISHWFPVWYLDWNPSKRIILTAYGDSLACDWGRVVRDEFQMNPMTWTKLRQDTQAVGHWLTTKDGGMRSAGVGGPITGKGADLLICDDPHKNWEDANSPIARQRLIDWFNSTFYTRAEPGASICVLMTRWHEHDLIGYLMNEHSDKWVLYNFPALAEENDIMARNMGEALCPERYTAERLGEIKKGLGEFMFAGLYQQHPSPLVGGMVHRDWLKFYTPESLPPEGQDLISLDPTNKKTGTSYVVAQVWRRAGPNFYLLDQIRDRMSFLECVQRVADLKRKWPTANEILVEEAANGPAIIDTLKQSLPGVLSIRAEVSKEHRLLAVSGLIESGNVFLPSRSDWVEGFVNEIVSFPSAVNDDQVDAMTMALKKLSDSYAAAFDIRLPTAGARTSPVREFYEGGSSWNRL